MTQFRNAEIKRERLAVKLKGYIAIPIALISLMLLLFLPYIVFVDNTIDVRIEISGVSYLISSFSNGFHSSSAELGDVFLGYNLAFTAFTWILFTLQFLIVVSYAVFYFALKKDPKWLCWLSYSGALLCLFMFIFFLVSNSTPLLDIYGETVPFYKSFEFGISILIVIVLDLLTGVISGKINGINAEKIKQYLPLYAMLLVPSALILVFSFYPIMLQTVLSFKNYKISDGIFKSEWVGWDNFKKMFTDSSMLNMLGNTVEISLCRMVLGIVPPLILALFLFDLAMPKYRKLLQTIIYIPHFFSWVIIFAIAYAFINQEGVINNIIVANGGSRIAFFNNESLFYPVLFITDVWKELGWGTILFLAALSGIDPTLYEAASVEGAGPMTKLFKITIPCIAPTIVFVSVMAIGNLLKGAGGEQILLFGSEQMESAQTIDTWVIWQGLNGGQYSLSSAVSFFQSVIGIVLVLLANRLSKKYTNMGIW